MENSNDNDSFVFYAISDFGVPNNNIKLLAQAMNNYAVSTNRKPNIIFGLGDNFYPTGVSDVSDAQFNTSWYNVFLIYSNLRVPWKMALGNHDYMGNPQAQIDYHFNRDLNKGGYWQMPAACYTFMHRIGYRSDVEKPSNGSICDVQFFVLDTNGCQGHVKQKWPQMKSALHRYISQLEERLQNSTAQWKIVLGHHPMYTQGRGHQLCAKCLREKEYSYPVTDGFSKQPVKLRKGTGYGLEEVLARQRVVAYFSGHEHVFQYHFNQGVHNFVCGASGAEQRAGSGMYGGDNEEGPPLDWVATAQDYGFVAGKITKNKMEVKFINVEGAVIKEVVVLPSNSVESSADSNAT